MQWEFNFLGFFFIIRRGENGAVAALLNGASGLTYEHFPLFMLPCVGATSNPQLKQYDMQ